MFIDANVKLKKLKVYEQKVVQLLGFLQIFIGKSIPFLKYPVSFENVKKWLMMVTQCLFDKFVFDINRYFHKE